MAHSLGLGRDWGLMPEMLNIKEGANKDSTVQEVLRWNNSPSMRLLLGDTMFLHHLKLWMKRPTERHLNQLTNRAKTLRRRRTDEVSNRFFLRD